MIYLATILVRFSRALRYDVGVYILYDYPGFLSATERGSPYRDFAEIVQKTAQL